MPWMGPWSVTELSHRDTSSWPTAITSNWSHAVCKMFVPFFDTVSCQLSTGSKFGFGCTTLFVSFLSLELQQIDCALTHDVNDLYVMADRGHVLIVRGLMSSYHTPLELTNQNTLHCLSTFTHSYTNGRVDNTMCQPAHHTLTPTHTHTHTHSHTHQWKSWQERFSMLTGAAENRTTRYAETHSASVLVSSTQKLKCKTDTCCCHAKLCSELSLDFSCSLSQRRQD